MDSDYDDYSVNELESDYEMVISNRAKAPKFEFITPDEIVELMNTYIKEVESVVLMPAETTTTRILLSHTGWDKQELLDRLTGENSDKFFECAKVQNPFIPKPKKEANHTECTCSICFMEFPQTDIVDLGCTHEFCKDCWCQYLTVKISDYGDADSIFCPAPKCGIVIDDATIMELVTDENIRQKYKHLMTQSFVRHKKNQLRWCPGPGCNLAIKAIDLLAYRKDCTCKCGHSICFNCGDDPHDPIDCELMANWKKNDCDETYEYLSKHTKNCPKCCSIIEKSGGCNHMSCRTCKYEFCWLCFNKWDGHGDYCVKNKGKNSTKQPQTRLDHYFNLYGEQKRSLKSDSELEERLDEMMRNLQALGLSWNEVQFIIKAFKILLESRRQLMFTYIFAYALKDHPQKIIFEANQADLVRATEELSRYFLQDLPCLPKTDIAYEVRKRFIHKSDYIEKRQRAMQEHIFDGFENNWWIVTHQI